MTDKPVGRGTNPNSDTQNNNIDNAGLPGQADASMGMALSVSTATAGSSLAAPRRTILFLGLGVSTSMSPPDDVATAGSGADDPLSRGVFMVPLATAFL